MVDNASTDGTAEWLATQPDLGVLRRPRNEGFGPAHNLALGYAKAPFFVVLNNDTEPQGAGWLERMAGQFAMEPRCAAVGVAGQPCQLNSQGVGGHGPRLDYLEGSCLMLRREVVTRIGLFDPAYRFAYCEDADLSLRLLADGYTLRTVELDLRHARAQTAGEAVARGVDLDGYKARNHQVLRTRWAGFLARGGRLDEAEPVTIRRTAALGDVLLVEPVIREFLRRGRGVRLVTRCPAAFEHYPGVKVMAAQRVPVGIDLDGAYEALPTQHIVAAYWAKAGLGGTPDLLPQHRPGADARAWAKQLLRGQRPVAVHLGRTAWIGRDWPAERFAAVLRGLGEQAVVIGDQHSPGLPKELVKHDLRGQTSVSQLSAVLEQCGLFLGIDSAPLHLAVAAQIPTVATFGAIDPSLRLPPVPWAIGVTAKLGCLGCHHSYPAPRTSLHKCLRPGPPQAVQACMLDLHPDAVIDAVRRARIAHMAYSSETQKIRDRALPFCQGRGADLGCGRDKVKPDAIGVDRRDSPTVDQLADLGGRLPFQDGELDYVFSSHALEDLADTEGVLWEWLRIMRPGGHLVLYVPHPDHYHGVNLDHVYPGFYGPELAAIVERLGASQVLSEVDVGEDRYSLFFVAQKH